jgi:hypothetical protein
METRTEIGERPACRGIAARTRSRLRRAAWPLLVSLLLLTAVCSPHRSMAQSSGIITTVVGPGFSGPVPNGATLQLPTAVAVDSAGSIYTADANNCVVWKTQNGSTSQFAGIFATTPGTCSGGTLPNADATVAPLAYPVALALCNGNLFIATHGVNAYPSPSTGGAVYEVTAGAISLLPLTIPPPSASPFFPIALACDATGNVYVSSFFYDTDDTFYGEVDKIAPGPGGTGWNATQIIPGLIDTVYPALVISPVDGDLHAFREPAGAGDWLGTPNLGKATILDLSKNSASGLDDNNSFNNPAALLMDSAGNYIVSEGTGLDAPTSLVEFVQHGGAQDGVRTTLAGTGVLGFNSDSILATTAQVNAVDGLAFDTSGNFYLADANNQRVRRFHAITPGPETLTLITPAVAQASTYGYQQSAYNPSTGDFYYVSGPNTVSVVNTGALEISPGAERIVASVVVGTPTPGAAGGPSQITLIADPTRNLIYACLGGTLYVIDGAPGVAESYTVVGHVALNNANAYLLAIDPGLNLIFVAGPNSAGVTVVQGGGTPVVSQNLGAPASFVSSIAVDTVTHTVYAVSRTGAGVGGVDGLAEEESLITLTPTGAVGIFTASNIVFPANEAILQSAFIGNSLAIDQVTGSLLASGAASIDTYYAQGYANYDFYQLPELVSAPSPFTWPPVTTVLDPVNRTFYVTDFDGTGSDPSSNAAMITGLDQVVEATGPLTTTLIPVFGSSATPSQPHVYDIEPDTSSYQAWLSGSDATEGGFVKLWDAQSQSMATAATAVVPNNGGGYLTLNSSAHTGYLMDNVNGKLYLINTPPWTTVPAPSITESPSGQSVTIRAGKQDDQVFYTADGSQPGTGSLQCNNTSSGGVASCTVNLTAGQANVIYAIEVATVSDVSNASNVTQGIFAELAATTIGVSLNQASIAAGASDSATATVTPSPGIASVSGTVTFTITPSGSSALPLCSAVLVQDVSGTYEAVCNFIEADAGSYTINANYSGDTQNQAGSGSSPTLTVTGGSSGGGGTPPTFSFLSVGDVLAVNRNQTGNGTNAFLNDDSSVGFLQNGVIQTQNCPGYSAFSETGISAGDIYVDAVNNIIYLALVNNQAAYASYESIDSQGNCTQGPLLQLSTFGVQQNAQMTVDPTQGNVYIMNYFGGNIDELYVIPSAAPWNASALPTPTSLQLDYSVTYGTITLDPSNHQVYINDLGGTGYGNPGTYTTSGFFVYDPLHSSTAANNFQHVVGYTSGSTTTPFNVGTLLNDGNGKLILVNENPTASTTNYLSVPITILDTTTPGFSFFTNTSKPNTFNNDVDITPGGALTNISATTQYSAIAAADIDVKDHEVDAFAFQGAKLSIVSGLLLQYSLTNTTSPETVLNSSAPLPVLYDDESGTWQQLFYNPFSTEITLAASPSAVGITSLLCSASLPISITQIEGNAVSTLAPNGLFSINDTSGYEYTVEGEENIGYIAPPTSGCTTTTQSPLQIYPASIGAASLNTAYTQPISTTGGSGSVTLTESGTPAPGITFNGTKLAGTPPKAGAFPITINAKDGAGDTTSQTYTLNVTCPLFSISAGGGALPAATIGITYNPSQNLAPLNANGTYSWQIISGSVPSGLSLGAGGLTGTPTGTAGTANFSATVTDSAGCSATGSYSLQVYNQLTITPTSLPNATAGVSYTQTFTAAGGGGPYTFVAAPGPAGLNLDESGVLFGTPLVSGSNFSVTVRATDTVTGAEGVITVPLVVASAPIQILPSKLPDGLVGTEYYAPFSAVNGSGTYTFTESGDTVPGLTFSAGASTPSIVASGPALSGIPTLSGSKFSITITAKDGHESTSKTYDLVIKCPTLSIAPASGTLLSAAIGSSIAALPFNLEGTATGAITWSATGTLPPGLTLATGNGLETSIAGTLAGPVATDSFTLTATDSAGCTASNTYSIQVTAASAAAQVTDNESITVSDGPPQVVVLDVADSSEVIGVVDTVNITATNASVQVTDEETISVSDGPPEVVVLDANDSGEVVNITDTVAVIAETDFILNFSGPSSVDLLPGKSLTLTLTATPLFGAYNNPVFFTVTGLPQGFTVTISPASVTPGSSPASATVTITAPQLQAHSGDRRRGLAPIVLALLLPLPLVCLRRARRTLRRGILLTLFVALSLTAMTGLTACAGNGFFNQAPQTYTVTVTGTSGALQHSTTIVLTVE